MVNTFILGVLGGLGAMEIMIIFLLLITVLIVKIFYLITLQRTMEKVKPENREMTPGQVWLEIIPLFGTVWRFFNVIYISNSLKKELEARNMPLSEPRPAYSIGIATCILFCCSFIPFVGLAAFICWIIYWVKVSNYKNML